MHALLNVMTIQLPPQLIGLTLPIPAHVLLNFFPHYMGFVGNGQACVQVPLSWVRRLKYLGMGMLVANVFIFSGLFAILVEVK